MSRDPSQPDAPKRRYTTPEGLKRLEARIEKARADYLVVCASNEEAAGSGDSSVWHDNFAFEENQRQMHQLARRVRDLEHLVASMELVPPAVEPPERVRVGCTVLVTFLDDDTERRFYVAGYEDGAPEDGRLSYTAPLARVVLGAEEGDTRVLRLKGRRRTLEISAIEAAPPEELAG